MSETTPPPSKKSFRSISFTLFFAFLGLSSFILFVESAINIYTNFQNQQQTISHEQQLIANDAGTTVQQFIEDKFSILDIVSSTNGLERASREQQEKILNKLLTKDLAFRQIILFNMEKKLLSKVSKISSTASSDIQRNIDDTVYSHIKQDEYYTSTSYIDKETSEPMILLAIPVKDVFGDIKGVLVAEVNLKSMWDLVSNIRVGEHGVAYVVDRKGRLLAFIDISRVLKGENLKHLKMVSEFVNGKGESMANASEITKGIYGTSVVTRYVALKEVVDWAVVIEQPLTEAYALIIQDLIRVGILITTTFGLVIFVSILLARRITQPIIHLRDAAMKISSGNLDTKIDVSKRDEIGELAETFNQMTVQLKENYGGLEQKVSEKTTQLSEKVADLENAKKAMANIMEDLQSDKAKIDEQKKVLDSVVQNMPIGVALSEANGKPILVNDAGINMLGRGIDPNATNEQIVETYNIFKPDGSPYPPAELTTVLAVKEGKTITKEDMVIHRPDGGKIVIRITTAPIKNSEGKILSIVSVFEDITKELEVDRMKTEFISLASHQLRTPLSAIKWFSEMLVAGDAGELTNEQKDFAQNISESTERMIDLVNSLLNISRIESGRIVIDPKPTDLKELVDSIVTELQVKIKEREQTLVVSVHGDLPKINVDPRLIRQVYMNLLTNAIKYTQKNGEISVFISKKDDQIISQVTDNGYGIPKEEQKKLFQKFFRANNIIKVETDGTGLGLYLLKAIIESSKGKVWFESYTKEESTPEHRQGTSFWFSLPMSGMEAKTGEVTLDM